MLADAAIELLQTEFGSIKHQVLKASDPGSGGITSRDAFPDWVKAQHLVEGLNNVVTVYVLLDNEGSGPV